MLQNPFSKAQSPNLARGLSEIDRQELEKLDQDSMFLDSVNQKSDSDKGFPFMAGQMRFSDDSSIFPNFPHFLSFDIAPQKFSTPQPYMHTKMTTIVPQLDKHIFEEQQECPHDLGSLLSAKEADPDFDQKSEIPKKI